MVADLGFIYRSIGVAGATGQVLIAERSVRYDRVAFGTTAAASFSVVSDSLITATYPATLSREPSPST